MGLDIELQVRKNNDIYYCEEFNGRMAFGNIKDFMLEKYNYQYGEYLKLNLTMIKSIVKKLINECYEKSDDSSNKRRLDFVLALIDSYGYIKQGCEVFFECDW